jgi:hypothetical protein
VSPREAHVQSVRRHKPERPPTPGLDYGGATVLTLRQLHPTVEQRDAELGFGAVELGRQTMDKLAGHLGA